MVLPLQTPPCPTLPGSQPPAPMIAGGGHLHIGPPYGWNAPARPHHVSALNKFLGNEHAQCSETVLSLDLVPELCDPLVDTGTVILCS